MAEGMRPDPALLSNLPAIEATDDPQLAAVLRERGFEIKKDRAYYLRTLASYRRLADAARGRGIIYLAMQYPTGKIAALKNLFSLNPGLGFSAFESSLYGDFRDPGLRPEYGGIIFIDNENFNKFTGAAYGEYFTDQFTRTFGGRFGHTTSKGHSLIAQNAARAIIGRWPEISRQAR
jgi:hypothetical protein